MFVFLSKFLPLFVYPLGLSCLLLFGALIWRKKERFGFALALTAFLVLLVASNRWVSYGLAKSLEWQYLPEGEISAREVIVLLGGGTDSAQYPRPAVELNGAADRILHAASLYKAGKAEKILLSGGTITWLGSNTSTPAEDMAQVLDMMGVPQEALWLQPKSQNTYEDALYSAEALREKGIDQVILVTSAMHMPRAIRLFEHQGIEVIPAPTDFRVTQASLDEFRQSDAIGWVVMAMPNVSYLSLTTSVMKEYLGMAVYGLRGWL